MLGRLAAPPASRACLDLAQIEALETEDGRIELVGPDAAARVYGKIRTRTRTLSSHPNRCRVVPELKSFGVVEYRELIVSPYRIFFRVDGRDVGIIGVLDGRRDLEETLVRRAMR